MPWNRIVVKRSELTRVGSTFGKNLSTVRGVRFMTQAAEGGENSEVRFEDTRFTGGVDRPIFGEVQYRYVYVRNDGTYLAKSAPSAASSKYTLNGSGATVRIPADGSRDQQANEIWLFRIGGGLPDWYRVVVKTGGPFGTGTVDIDDTVSVVDALTVNVVLELDNVVPPDNIIGIAGPYYDRTFYLTATHLYPSRRRNPDSCSTGQIIQIAGADEVGLWVRKTLGGLYVGTTKDIYRLAGDGAEYPDGSINFTLQNLNIDSPPVSAAIAQEGNFIVYLAADGWRRLAGAGSEPIAGATSLLYHGYDRHGVSAINIDAGRFRAAIAQGMLSAITPEGADINSSTKLYRHRFNEAGWYRHIYPPSWRSIHKEPDGTLIAGDGAGFVWVLDDGTSDGGEPIPYEFWTRNDDVGHPFSRKDPYDFRVLVMSGGRDVSIGLYLNNSGTSSMTLTANTDSMEEALYTLSDLPSFRLLQLRVFGSTNTFRWAATNLGFHPLPMLMRGHTPPYNFDKPGVKTISSLQLRICTLGAIRTVTPVLDGVAYPTFQVQSAVDEPINRTYTFPSGASATELMLRLDGDVEMYEWYPLVTAIKPLGVRVWDSGPSLVGQGELIWPREVWLHVIASNDIVVHYYFDGISHGTVLADVGPLERNVASKIRVPIPRGYKGRVPRLVLRSVNPFYLYWIELVNRQTRAGSEKPPLRIDGNFGGQSSI